MSSLPVFTQINFPAATLLINFLGAFIIGLVAVSAIHFEGLHPAVVLFFKTGLCGGFTTVFNLFFRNNGTRSRRRDFYRRGILHGQRCSVPLRHLPGKNGIYGAFF